MYFYGSDRYSLFWLLSCARWVSTLSHHLLSYNTPLSTHSRVFVLASLKGRRLLLMLWLWLLCRLLLCWMLPCGRWHCELCGPVAVRERLKIRRSPDCCCVVQKGCLHLYT